MVSSVLAKRNCYQTYLCGVENPQKLTLPDHVPAVLSIYLVTKSPST
jgi:hypothetical protein